MARGLVPGRRDPRDVLLDHLCSPWDWSNPWDWALLGWCVGSAVGAGALWWAAWRVVLA